MLNWALVDRDSQRTGKKTKGTPETHVTNLKILWQVSCALNRPTGSVGHLCCCIIIQKDKKHEYQLISLKSVQGENQTPWYWLILSEAKSLPYTDGQGLFNGIDANISHRSTKHRWWNRLQNIQRQNGAEIVFIYIHKWAPLSGLTLTGGVKYPLYLAVTVGFQSHTLFWGQVTAKQLKVKGKIIFPGTYDKKKKGQTVLLA